MVEPQGPPQLLALSMQPAGIPDGGAVYAQGAVPLNSTRYNKVKALIQRPIVRAILSSVVFANGQFVGTDEHGTFEEFGKRIKGITEDGNLARMQS